LGHPLADVSFNCLAWHTLPSKYGGILGLDFALLGIPEERAYLAHYYAQSGRGSNAENTVGIFQYAFSLFRFAVIFEGIAARAATGNAASENAAEVGRLGQTFAQRAVAMIESA
jgi:aminoglycoside phosphotransferase (APT) family kinase protein